jgi:hypothetical protein
MLFLSVKYKKFLALLCIFTTFLPNISFVFADVVRDTFAADSFLPGEIDDVVQLDDIVLWNNEGITSADTRISEEGTRPESGTPYHARLRNNGSISRTFDTTARKNLQLQYFWQGDLESDTISDVLSVYWKKSSEEAFILLGTHILSSREWTEASWDLPTSADNTLIDIKFV